MKKLLCTLIAVFFISGFAFSQIGGYALYLDGSDDFVNCGTSSSLNPTTAFTIEMWVNIPDTSKNMKLLSKFAWGYLSGYIFGVANGHLYPEIFTCTGSGWNHYQICSGTISPNTWTHLAVTWASGGYLIGYINGVKIDSVLTAYPMTSSNSSSLFLGKWDGFNTLGKMDEIRIWNVTRTESEIKANMYKELVGNESGLKAYYKMSNGSGTTLTDNSGNNNNGTLNNGPVWIASGCFAGPKNCLDFDGIDDYVAITSGVVLGTTFTQEMWIYPTDASVVYRGILGQQPTNSPSRCPCVYQYGRKVHFGMGNGSTWYSDITNNDVLTINSWNHVAVTFDGTTYLVYVNGRLIYTSLCCSGLIPLNVAQSGIGRVDNYFAGKIDEVRIWSTVRTLSQIRENFMNTLAGNESGLQAYYKMDYSDGTSLYDITSNSRNGTLTNMDPATDWVTSGAFNTWIGSESNSWSTVANWSKGTAPVSTDNVGIYKWATGNELTISGTPTVNHLFFSSTSSPTLSSDFYVNGELILNRDINLNGNVITLGVNGNLNEESNRLYGTSGTITTTRDLSALTAYNNIGGLGVSITTSLVGMGSTTITRGHATQGSNSSISRYFDITPTINLNLLATMVFGYNENELNGNTESDLKLFKSTNGGTNWTVQNSSTVNINDNSITQTLIGGFSRWTAANSNSPMPVELMSFTSNVNERNVLLKWVTNKESNNKGFYIERKSSDGVWIQIGFKDGKGTTSDITTYTFDDTKLNPGKYFYRLKQIDFNGNFAYHNLSGSIEISIPSKFSLSRNYPNPFNPVTKIDYEIPIDCRISIKVFDMAGKEITNLVNGEYIKAGYHTVTFYGADFASGVYFYRIQAEGKTGYTAVKKMVMIK